MFDPILHTEIVILDRACMEVVCTNPRAAAIQRNWFIRRTVDLNTIVWC